jgi:hypothetical protein
MTPEQHADDIVKWFKRNVEEKYFKGQKEHGGRLWRKPVLSMLRDEVVDAATYFEVLEAQHREAAFHLKLCMDAFNACSPDDAESHAICAYNLLTIGNIEGLPEEEK